MLSFSWRQVALAALLVTVALLITLAVVVTVRGTDVLSTVALVLAVVAFVVQLVMFVATTGTTSQQSLQSQELNAQTGRLLQESQGTLAEMRELAGARFDRVLDRVLGEAREVVQTTVAEEAAESTSQPRADAGQDRAVMDVSAIYESALRNALVHERSPNPRLPDPLVEMLTTYPSGGGRQITPCGA